MVSTRPLIPNVSQNVGDSIRLGGRPVNRNKGFFTLSSVFTATLSPWLSLFPCEKGRKHPSVRWKTNPSPGTDDLAKDHSWFWDESVTGAFGVANGITHTEAGQYQTLVCIDVDQDVPEVYSLLSMRLSKDLYAVARTPRGGAHIWFLQQADTEAGLIAEYVSHKRGGTEAFGVRGHGSGHGTVLPTPHSEYTWEHHPTALTPIASDLIRDLIRDLKDHFSGSYTTSTTPSQSCSTSSPSSQSPFYTKGNKCTHVIEEERSLLLEVPNYDLTDGACHQVAMRDPRYLFGPHSLDAQNAAVDYYLLQALLRPLVLNGTYPEAKVPKAHIMDLLREAYGWGAKKADRMIRRLFKYHLIIRFPDDLCWCPNITRRLVKQLPVAKRPTYLTVPVSVEQIKKGRYYTYVKNIVTLTLEAHTFARGGVVVASQTRVAHTLGTNRKRIQSSHRQESVLHVHRWVTQTDRLPNGRKRSVVTHLPNESHLPLSYTPLSPTQGTSGHWKDTYAPSSVLPSILRHGRGADLSLSYSVPNLGRERVRMGE